MRKYLVFFICLLLAVVAASPPAYAFGGFVVKEGSTTFHDIYCDEVEGCKINELQWYDTAEEASEKGFLPCQVCDAENGFDFEYDLETIWKTDNHLIQSAMELESETAFFKGEKRGYEEGYEEGIIDGKYSGYNEGYYDGLDAGQEGYDTGYDEGYKAATKDAVDELDKSLMWIVIVVLSVVALSKLSKLLRNRKVRDKE